MDDVEEERVHTVGNLLLVQQISKQVFPTAPSPTVTHLMNLEALEAIVTKNKNKTNRQTEKTEEKDRSF